MTKIVKAKLKTSRKLKVNLWGREKDPFLKKNYRPGQHGAGFSPRVSDYGIQLRAKQQLRFYYGNITEKQFRNTFKKASRKKGDKAENFIATLESRLDIVVYRANFVPTVFSARQFISHKHITVNDKIVNIPSYFVKPGDVIKIKDSSKEINMVLEAKKNKERDIPAYLKLNDKDSSIEFLNYPAFAEVPYPVEMEPNLVVEFYSR